MPKMTEDQRKQLAELEKLKLEETEEEKALQALEADKKKAEKDKQEGLRTGDKEKVKEAKADLETIAVSESTIHALLEQLKRQEALMELWLAEKGVPQSKIDEVKRRRFVGPNR